MTWSGAGCNHADKDINKFENGKKIKRRGGDGLSLLEDDAWNITTYEPVPDLWGDSFIVGYHVP